MQQSEKTLAKNTIFLYLMQISGYIFPLLTFPYLTRVLGAEKYGIVVFANAFMQYFTMFFDFGFLLSATNQCSLHRNNKSKLGNITFGIIGAKFILVLIATIILGICLIYVNEFNSNITFFILSYIAIFITIFLPDYLFRGIEQMSIITYRVIISKIIYTVCIFLFIRKSTAYNFIPVSTIISNVIAVILTWYEIKKKKLICLSKVTLKEILLYLKDSSFFFLSRVATSLYSTLNTVLLGFRFSNVEIGSFGVSNTLAGTCKSFLSPISDSIYPYLVNNKNFKLVKKIIFILEPIIIFGCGLLFIISNQLIRIVCGEGYDNAVSIFRAMLPSVIITLPSYLFGYPVLGALGKVNVANISVIVGAVFHVISLLVLFIISKLSFFSVVILTFFTELIVLGIRSVTVIRIIKHGGDNKK